MLLYALQYHLNQDAMPFFHPQTIKSMKSMKSKESMKSMKSLGAIKNPWEKKLIIKNLSIILSPIKKSLKKYDQKSKATTVEPDIMQHSIQNFNKLKSNHLLPFLSVLYLSLTWLLLYLIA